MSGLAVPDREFQRLLEAGTVQLDPPLSEAAIDRMWHNRNATERAAVAYLDDEPAVDRYRVYAQAALYADAKRRRLERRSVLSVEDVEALARQREIVQAAAVRLFSLLEPMLPCHDAWSSPSREYRAIDTYADRPYDLPADDAYVAVQEMRRAADAFGLRYERRSEPSDPFDHPEYWLDESEPQSAPPADRDDGP